MVAADGVVLGSWSICSRRSVDFAPTVTANTPANGATGVSVGSSVTASFSRAMNGGSITSSSFTLTPAGGSPVAATVSYAGTTATLSPSSSLVNNTVYTAKLDTSV